MPRDLTAERRGVASVIAVTLLVALAVILATTVSGFVLVDEPELPPPAPQVGVSHQLVTDGSERSIAVTMDAGDAVAVDQLYVVGSKPLDVGGAPNSTTPANESGASARENVAERTGGTPQVGVGNQWESGETIYLDPEGSAAGVTVSIYWNTEPVTGTDPGTVTGDDAYLIVEFRV